MKIKKHNIKIKKHNVKNFHFPVKTMGIVLFCLVIVFLGVGYAAISSTLTTQGSVDSTAQSGLFITNVSVARTNGATSSQDIKTYYSTLLTNYIHLDENGNSYIIYKVDVINKYNKDYEFIGLTYDPSSGLDTYTNEYIVPEIITVSEAETLGLPIANAIEIGDPIAADNGTAYFYVKYYYDQSIVSGGTVASNYQTLSNGIVNYVFEEWWDTKSDIVTHPDGSWTETITYHNGNVMVKDYDNGDRITGYEITTPDPNDCSGVGFDLIPGENVDTRVPSFDEHAFNINISFCANVSSYTDANNVRHSNSGKFVLSAIKKDGSTYDGFALFDSSGTQIRVGTFYDSSLSNGSLVPKYDSGSDNNISATMQKITANVQYNPTGYLNIYATLTVKVNSGSTKTLRNQLFTKRIPESSSAATIKLGGNGLNSNEDFYGLSIKSLTITKTY